MPPAPTEMFETVIQLKPKEQWRAGLSVDKLIAEMDAALQFPGVSNAWTMPIKGRLDMLSTGIRTPIGVKIFGRDLNQIETLARQVETVLKKVPGASSAYAERIIGGYYLEIVPDRSALARYGLTIGDVQEVIATALGGETVTTTVEGREQQELALASAGADAAAEEVIGHQPQQEEPRADGQRGKVLKFDSDLKFVNAFGRDSSFRPVDVCVKNDKIFVSDVEGHRIDVFKNELYFI